VAAGDFNGHGIPDLAVANAGSNTVRVLTSKGDGTFGLATNFHVSAGPISVAVGNFKRDGATDLAVVALNRRLRRIVAQPLVDQAVRAMSVPCLTSA
jgi:hypothetical protein